MPSRIALDLIVEEAGRISFAPKIDGVSPEAMRQAFLALDDVEAVYSLDHPEGGRVRVVLDETQREVLHRMQRVRHLSGADRTEVLRDPLAVFDGEGGIEFRGKSILVDNSFVRALDELVERITPSSPISPKPPELRRFLLIYTNEGELEYDEPYEGKGEEAELVLPRALKADIQLMSHQKNGIAWL